MQATGAVATATSAAATTDGKGDITYRCVIHKPVTGYCNLNSGLTVPVTTQRQAKSRPQDLRHLLWRETYIYAKRPESGAFSWIGSHRAGTGILRRGSGGNRG